MIKKDRWPDALGTLARRPNQSTVSIRSFLVLLMNLMQWVAWLYKAKLSDPHSVASLE